MADKRRFANGNFYHVYNRGVEKRKICMDDKDRFRFVHDLFELNDHNAVMNALFYSQRNAAIDSIHGERQGKHTVTPKRECVVDIVAWALMPNHYHFLLRQRMEGGVSLFMKKLGGGYTLYFNQRHHRSGVLFQGTFKAKGITGDSYLRHLVSYIHANPKDLMLEQAKGRNGMSATTRERALRRYRWSSYRDYAGEKNFPSVLNGALLRDLGFSFGRAQQGNMRDWLGVWDQREKDLQDFLLD